MTRSISRHKLSRYDIIHFIIYPVLFLMLAFVMTADSMIGPDDTVEVKREELATLFEEIIKLHDQVANLRKNIQILTDFLDEITTMVKDAQKPSKAPPVQVASFASAKTPLPVISDGNLQVLLVKVRTNFGGREEEKVYNALINTENKSSFVQSLRGQLVEWLNEESTFPSPMSPKQLAWAAYLMFPKEHQNPKLNKELYP